MSPTSIIHYYIASTHHGTISLKSPRKDDLVSHAFLCPTCGEVWARIVVDDGARWWATLHLCETCPSTSWWHKDDVGGSLLAGTLPTHRLSFFDWPRALNVLPHNLLLREFLLHSKGLVHGSQPPSPLPPSSPIHPPIPSPPQ